MELINDFVAQGYGMLTLGDSEVTRLNDVEPETNGTIACVGAGTGGHRIYIRFMQSIYDIIFKLYIIVLYSFIFYCII